MRILIDANILLDVMQKREPHFAASAGIWKLCEAGQVQGCVSTLTFANLVYVMRRELTPERIEETQSKLAQIFRFVALTPEDIAQAAKMRWPDFEDAAHSAIAARLHADRIVPEMSVISREVRFRPARQPNIWRKCTA